MKALGLPISEKKNFEVCLLCYYVQNCDPRSGACFDPRGLICANLVEVHKEILYTKYQSSTTSSFREQEF